MESNYFSYIVKSKADSEVWSLIIESLTLTFLYDMAYSITVVSNKLGQQAIIHVIIISNYQLFEC